MEVKKSPKADLENKRSIFMLVGLAVVLGLILFAFEWSTETIKDTKEMVIQETTFEDEEAPVTTREEIKPPPPPPPPQVVEVLEIVDNSADIEEDLDLFDTESDEAEEVDFTVEEYGDGEEEEASTEIFVIVEDMPEFPGGEKALREYIAKSVKYPVIAQENGIQGRVFVSFVIGASGAVEDVKIARGVDPSLDKEAIRVVESMPSWKPGKQRGKAVRVSYTVPIMFQLQ